MITDKITVIQPTFDSDYHYFRRCLAGLSLVTDFNSIDRWIFANNGSSEFADYIRESTRGWGNKTEIIVHQMDANYQDLPVYEQVLPLVRTEIYVGTQADVRPLQASWVQLFLHTLTNHPEAGMMGQIGPGENMTPENVHTHGGWAWVLQQVLDLGLPADSAFHIQTHFHAMRVQAFKEAGFFWVPEGGPSAHKGNVIAAEVQFGSRLRKAGWKLQRGVPPHHHYGTHGVQSRPMKATLDMMYGYDKERGVEPVPGDFLEEGK